MHLNAATDTNAKRNAKRTRGYRSWERMKYRCLSPKYHAFHRYGGRGITFHPAWTDFAAFIADLGEPPEGMTLDRFPNRDGNYEPGNVRWATAQQQAANKCDDKKLDATDIGFIRHWMAAGYSCASIARAFSVTRPTIQDIKSGRTRKQVAA